MQPDMPHWPDTMRHIPSSSFFASVPQDRPDGSVPGPHQRLFPVGPATRISADDPQGDGFGKAVPPVFPSSETGAPSPGQKTICPPFRFRQRQEKNRLRQDLPAKTERGNSARYPVCPSGRLSCPFIPVGSRPVIFSFHTLPFSAGPAKKKNRLPEADGPMNKMAA